MHKEIGIEVVKTKNVLLWFSGLNISSVDISILESIYEEISNEDQYKIVWIPIEEKWTDDMQKKFDMLQSKMPTWYIVHNYSFKLGIKYVREKWQFKNKPIVVVMNSQGIVHGTFRCTPHDYCITNECLPFHYNERRRTIH